MKNTYFDLIDQTFEFPQLGFGLNNNHLTFHGIPLMPVIERFGTPIKLTYIPKIGEQIERARQIFLKAIEDNNYPGKYNYCYCTKSSHFQFVLREVMTHNGHLETSSAFDMEIVEQLYQKGLVTKQTYIICNGYKMPQYIKRIADFINNGFENIIPILDSMDELKQYYSYVWKPFKIGIRIAAEEEPNFQFYTSRLGVRYRDILEYYRQHIKGDPRVELKMLHFFINTGIKDEVYYWSELQKCISLYCELKKECPELDSFDIGGGFPVPNSLRWDYDYEYMAGEIVRNIKEGCDKQNVPVPDLFSEFGKYTVAESGCTIYKVISEKHQNDSEKWFMLDSSIITTLPDTWGIGQKFILLAVNNWDREYQRVNLGGLTCDSQDYYNSEVHDNQVFLPKLNGEPLYVGFFHTGAYQESLGGYGGIQHCLIPHPKHILVDRLPDGQLTYRIYSEEQTPDSMMKILGYQGA